MEWFVLHRRWKVKVLHFHKEDKSWLDDLQFYIMIMQLMLTVICTFWFWPINLYLSFYMSDALCKYHTYKLVCFKRSIFLFVISWKSVIIVIFWISVRVKNRFLNTSSFKLIFLSRQKSIELVKTLIVAGYESLFFVFVLWLICQELW